MIIAYSHIGARVASYVSLTSPIYHVSREGAHFHIVSRISDFVFLQMILKILINHLIQMQPVFAAHIVFVIGIHEEIDQLAGLDGCFKE